MRAGSSVFLEEAIGSEGQHLRSSDRANEGKANGTAALSAKRKACVAPQRSHVHQPVRAMFHAVDSAFWNTVAGPVVSISHLTSAARAVLNCLRTALSRSAFACLAGVGLRFIAHVLPARSTPISRDPLRPSGCSHSSIARVPAGLLFTIQVSIQNQDLRRYVPPPGPAGIRSAHHSAGTLGSAHLSGSRGRPLSSPHGRAGRFRKRARYRRSPARSRLFCHPC